MDAADIAWILAATALVLLMFPGLAMLYGGMLDGKNTLNMMMMVMGSLAVTCLVYVPIGHGIALGNSVNGWGLFGNPLEYSFFTSFIDESNPGAAVSGAFFILFAAISVALAASGAAGRMKFGAWMIFAAIWVLLVYSPIAHWIFAASNPDEGIVGGWMLNVLDMHDYAGGTAVHMSAGASGLALAAVLGRRKNTSNRPHNLPVMLIGVGMLTMGWLGFNGGTAAGANFVASYTVLTTIMAIGGGMLGFIVVEKIRDGHATVLGLGTGTIAGMVAITPVANAVHPMVAVLVGFAGAAAAAWAITWKRRHKIDDSLDVFAVHGIAGIAGAYVAVFLATEKAPAGFNGIFLGGDINLLWREGVGIIATIVYAFVVTYAIAWVMNKIRRIRVDEEDEHVGLDQSIHAETAYELRVL